MVSEGSIAEVEAHYDEVLRAAGHRDATLRKWFVYADFDLSHIPDYVTIFRGGVCFKTDDHYFGNAPASLCWGHSWSIDRDTACFFASVLRASPRRTAIRASYR